jgi:hypothetical protein
VIRFVPALSALAGFPTAWADCHMVFRALDGLLDSLDDETYIALRGGLGHPPNRNPPAARQHAGDHQTLHDPLAVTSMRSVGNGEGQG